MYQPNTYNTETKKACYDIKNIDTRKEAIDIMISFFNKTINLTNGDVIVPAPQHIGYADYTLELATKLVAGSNAIIADILKCVPHKSVCDQKKEGIKPTIKMYLKGEIPKSKNIYFLDNVIATGTTYNEACKLIPGIKPLVFAIDYDVYERNK